MIGEKRTRGVILIRGARQVLTLRGSAGPRCGTELRELNIINDGSVLIQDGLIQEIGPTRRIENLASARGAVEISAAGRVVMPGFVDSHTHLLFPSPGDSGPRLENASRHIRGETGVRLQKTAQACLNSMARHGTTTVEVKTGCGPDESAETKLLRVLAALKDNPLHVVPTFLFRLPKADLTGDEGIDAAAQWIFTELIPKVHRRHLARFGDLVWDLEFAHLDHFVRYLDLIRKLGFPGKIHAEEENCGPAIDLAVRQLAVSIDHLEYATGAESALLAGTGTLATLLPCAALHNGGRSAPARALIDAGAAVALATNFNPLHSPILNMQTVVALACQHLHMTTEEAISAATINGAHALKRADRVGSLERGKVADLTILNLTDYRDLANHLGTNLVHMTMRRGDFIYKEGEVAPREPEEFSFVPAWE